MEPTRMGVRGGKEEREESCLDDFDFSKSDVNYPESFFRVQSLTIEWDIGGMGQL